MMIKPCSAGQRWLAGWVVVGMTWCVPAPAAGAEEVAAGLLRASGLNGGFVVHAGCADGRLTAELGRDGRFVVQGLEWREAAAGGDGPAEASKAREHIAQEGLYGRVSIDLAEKGVLPYVDGLVNVLVIHDLGLVKGLSAAEILRVLAPGGTVLSAGGVPEGLKDARDVEAAAGWKRVVKPRPAGMAEWTHNTHGGADGHHVSTDKALGYVTGPRWLAAPAWPIGYRKNSGFGIMATRKYLFYGRQQWSPTAPRAMVSNYLAARDVHSGVLLWDKRITPAAGDAKRRGGGYDYATPMAAEGEQVFLPLAEGLAAFESATGRQQWTYGPGGPLEMVLGGDRVFVVMPEEVAAVERKDGKPAWKRPACAMDLVLADGRLFYLEVAARPYSLVCLDARTGQPVWEVPTPWGPWGGKSLQPRVKAMTLCFHQEGVIILAQGERGYMSKVHAVAARDGSLMWSHEFPSMVYMLYHKNVFHINGLVWVNRYEKDIEGDLFGPKGRTPTYMEGLDLKTGEVKKRIDKVIHVKCGPGYGWDRCILGGKTLQYIDVETGKARDSVVGFGGCGIGIAIANGSIYIPPQACGCLGQQPVRGLAALSVDSWSATPEADKQPAVLEKGEAYGQNTEEGTGNPQSAIRNPQSSDWPTLRHDGFRSGGSAKAEVPPGIEPLWEARPCRQKEELFAADWGAAPSLAQRLTGAVVAGGRAVLALPEEHRVVCLDAGSGKELWSRTLGGRIDSPPTLHKGMCLVGCRDGWVYALRAADGALVWRLRAAPADRRIIANGQPESLWTVPGSVLAEDGTVCFMSGRWSSLPAGLTVWGVEAATGKVLWKTAMSDQKGASGSAAVLSSGNDGYAYFWRIWRVKVKDGQLSKTAWLVPPPVAIDSGMFGFHDGSWTRYPANLYHGMSVTMALAGARSPLLVAGPDRQTTYALKTRGMVGGAAGHYASGICAMKGPKTELWTLALGENASLDAMALAGGTLFAGGARDWDKRKEGYLWAISAETGEKLKEWVLSSPPVYEGMSVAGGRLYVAVDEGKLVCFGAKEAR